MPAIVSLLGSPSATSRSAHLLAELETRLAAAVGAPLAPTRLALRELPADALLLAQSHDPVLQAAARAVQEARVLLVATPIYKAAYSGLLKTFLDLLPPDALRGKTVVPLATGGSPAHLLALDYALKPVLGALGARDIRDAVFAADAQLPRQDAGYGTATELALRLDRITDDLLGLWPPRRAAERPLLRVAGGAAVAERCSS